MGPKLSKGLGAGGNPDLGKKSAVECDQDIRKALEGADMVFLAAGMGGGTGTGAIPIIAKIAKEMDILTVGIVTKPFMFEGKRRRDNATAGLADLKNNVDSIIVVPNDKLLQTIGRIPMTQAFVAADNVLRQAVQTITDLISETALINLDFADIRSTLKDQGTAMFGIGIDRGENRATKAAEKAVSSPLLETSIHGCTNAIVNVTGGNDVTTEEIEEAVDVIRHHANTDINIIFGFANNDKLKDEIIVTIVATGMSEVPQRDAVQFNSRQPVSSSIPVEKSIQQTKVQEEDEYNGFFKRIKQ